MSEGKLFTFAEIGPVDYVVSGSTLYEPRYDDYGGEWLFVRRGQFDDSVLEEDSE